jgi:hypothetical protein
MGNKRAGVEVPESLRRLVGGLIDANLLRLHSGGGYSMVGPDRKWNADLVPECVATDETGSLVFEGWPPFSQQSLPLSLGHELCADEDLGGPSVLDAVDAMIGPIWMVLHYLHPAGSPGDVWKCGFDVWRLEVTGSVVADDNVVPPGFCVHVGVVLGDGNQTNVEFSVMAFETALGSLVFFRQ